MKIELLYVFFSLLCSVCLIEGLVKISPDKRELEIRKNESPSLSCSSNTRGAVEWLHWNGTRLKDGPNLTIHSTSYSYMDTGYFICRAKSNINDVANIYIYFFDEKHFLTMNDSSVLNVTDTKYNYFTLPCRSTSPNITVDLTREGYNRNAIENDINGLYDRKIGYNISTKSINKYANFACSAKYNSKLKEYKIQVVIHQKNHTRPETPDKPNEKSNSGFLATIKKYWYAAVGGIVIILVIVVLLIWVCLKKCKKSESPEQGNNQWEEVETSEYIEMGPPRDKNSRTESGLVSLCPPQYKRNYEFPPEKLELGKLLGSGTFGVIKKAEANGITEEGVKTVVALKMYKCQSNPLFMKALNNELKTMIYLDHINIVNLLGACTRDSSKGELAMIVEYCKYGNLRDFILNQRNSYLKRLKNNGEIDFISKRSEKSENQRISILSQGSTTESQEYLLNDSKNYDPKWDLIDLGDYGDSKKVTIKVIDFITWCFQIANGMQYLASRKIVHGDLAARNVLLAEGNIVKICSIGLSKSMYEGEEYRNKRIALPIKWMATESIQDKIFTTESDIWSFGTTMWEIFSVGSSPYPGLEHAANLLDKLESGHRLDQPKFATPELYAMMKDCWNRDPRLRPSFLKLCKRLEHLLEESIQSHHTNLNRICEKTKAGLEETENYFKILKSYTHPTPNENPSTLFDNPAYTVIEPLESPEYDNKVRQVNTPHYLHGNPTHVPKNEARWSCTNGPISYRSRFV